MLSCLGIQHKNKQTRIEFWTSFWCDHFWTPPTVGRLRVDNRRQLSPPFPPHAVAPWQWHNVRCAIRRSRVSTLATTGAVRRMDLRGSK